jgi:hypothetical protein
MKTNSQLDIHPDAESLNAFAEEALAERERGQILAHLAACGRCRQVVYLAQEAALGMETAPAAGVPAVHSAIRPDSWFRSWRFAWVSAAALAAVIALALFVHIRRLDHGAGRVNQSFEMARVAPLPVLQSEGSVAKPASEERESAKAVKSAVPTVAAKASAGNLKSVPPSADSRPRQEEFSASTALASGAGAIGQSNVDRDEAAMPPGAPGAGPGGMEAAQYKPEPAVAAWQEQQFSGAQQNHATAAKATAQARVKVMADSMEAGRGLAPATPAPQREAKTAPLGNFEVTEQPRLAGILAAYKAKTTELPGGLPVVSTATALHQVLAIDQAGTLFLSEDAGSHWERVARQWTGSAVAVRVRLDFKGNAAATQAGGGSKHGLSSSAAGALPSHAAVFEIVNDKDLVWLSADGRTWKAQ